MTNDGETLKTDEEKSQIVEIWKLSLFYPLLSNNVNTYTSHLNPDGVVVDERAVEVGGQLGRVHALVQALQRDQVRLKGLNYSV